MNITLDHVTKYYQDNGKSTKGIEDVNLSFDTNGSFVVITGESGAGKSTLIRILTGLEDFDEGEILIDGMPLSSLNEKQRLDFYRKNISFVFQDYNLVESFSAQENIVLALLKQGMELKEAKVKANEVLKQVGLEKQSRMIASKLSGGERQRVAIARSVALNTQVIIFDEPTGNLDQDTSTQIIDLIQTLVPGRLIIYVTHEYQQVVSFVSRHIVLADGHILKDETILGPRRENIPSEGSKGSDRYPLRHYLFSARLFSFRRPGRFIATAVILLISAFAFFGAALGSSSILIADLFGGETAGEGFGNTLVVQKKAVSDPDFAIDGAVLDYCNVDTETVTLFRDGKPFSNRDAETIQTSINPYFPESYELTDGRLAENDDEAVIIFGDSSYGSYQNSMAKELLGSKVHPLCFESYVDASMSDGDTDPTVINAVNDAINASPGVVITGILKTKEPAVDSYYGLLSVSTSFFGKFVDMENSIIRGEADLDFSHLYHIDYNRSASYSYQILDGDKRLLLDTGYGYSPDLRSSLVLSTYWQNKDLDLVLRGFSLRTSSLANVHYADDIDTYSYGIFDEAACFNRILFDTRISARAFFRTAKEAKAAVRKLEAGGYVVTYMEARHIVNKAMDLRKADVLQRIIVLVVFMICLVILILVSLLVRNLLNKFYYRKDNDQMVLGYIGYAKKDMLIINLIEFLSLILIDIALIYTLFPILVPYVGTCFQTVPGLFIAAMLLNIVFTFFVALPNRRRIK